MVKRRALAGKNAPRRLPLTFLVLLWLVLDRLQPAGWVLGIVWTIAAILSLIVVWDYFYAQDVDLP